MAWFRDTTLEGGGWMIIWEGVSGVVTVGSANLCESLETTVVEMSQDFANIWLSIR